MAKHTDGKRPKVPPITFQVQEALRAADEFLTFDEICYATKCSHNQVSAALYHLCKFKVVEAVPQAEELFYFLTGEDNRVRYLELRAKEEQPRNRRKTNVRKVSSPWN